MNRSSSHSSRTAILDRIRTRRIDAPPVPDLDASKLTTFDDPVDKFLEMSNFVGGQPHQIDSEQEIAAILSELAAFKSAKKIVSLADEVVPGNVDPSTIDDPHDFASLDWVIARGAFPVAENGAIWVPGNMLPHRVLLFIPQFLAIIVSRSQMVHNMHQAYAKIGHPPSGFGVFVAGPSKTADIEQSLVLGAHGCRALQVFLTP